ncbi:ribulose-phosphate 3-epimerase [Mycoplasma iguanae]|uniref:Ribulose-phosphate 3-epimerase n=1 Tax=Mycoplasma iguanae TaxID=292461 RepID=A0ABY5R8J4_9MOLU|nr:ribulose-phosphate 3-epimerase [Mycoplasma iguanae]UVD81763.1 ribulose-phosphate 3-epimerase [Mycoplasma iguanae]
MKKYIAASLLNIESSQRVTITNDLLQNGIQWIHYDVMDGKFVPNLAIEPEEIANIKKNTVQHIADAHLMVQNPAWYAEKLIGAVDYVTLHFESLKEEEIINFIDRYQQHFKIGLAIKPNTPLAAVKHLFEQIDLLLVMSVEPGKGGQKFIESSLEKIAAARKIINEKNLDIIIQVDGGINDQTAPQCFQHGANVLVAGTFLVLDFSAAKVKALLKEN